MLESFVITLREGIEAALAVGIVLVCLRRAGRTELVRAVHLGLGTAILASLAGAFLLSRLNLDEELTEGVLLISAAILTVSLVVWMQRHGRTLKREIEDRVGRITAPEPGAAGGAGRAAALGVAAFTFFMVFREGVETVLLLAAVNLNSESLLAFAGGVAGLAIAVVFGVALVKGAVRIDLPRFFRVTAILLYLFAAQMLLSGLHELGEGGVIPIGRREMQIIGPIVKAQSLFLAALLSVPLILLLVPGRRAPASGETEGASAPERRQALARERRDRFWKMAAGIAGLVIIASLTVSYAYTRVPAALDPPVLVPLSGDELRLPVAGLDDGSLHRLGVESGGTTVRFLVMKKPGGGLATAFDACSICGAGGYVPESGRLVCRVCAADLQQSSLGSGGGCNPIPLASRVEGNELVIARADLLAHAAVFGGGSARP